MTTVAELEGEASATTSHERMVELAQHRSARVRSAVAGNAYSSDDLVATLIRDQSETVRLTAATSAQSRPAIHAVVAQSPDQWVRAILAHAYALDRPGALSYDIQQGLANDDFRDVRQRIAETTEYQDLFEALMNDDDARVRGACASNPRISREQMDRLLSDRRALTRANAIALGLRFPDDDQLIRMASDRSVGVRWKVLFRPGTPRRAVELIATDPDPINRQHAESYLDGGTLAVDLTRREGKMPPVGFRSPPSTPPS